MSCFFDAQYRQATSCLHEMAFAGCKNMERVSAECSGACRVGTYSISVFCLSGRKDCVTIIVYEEAQRTELVTVCFLKGKRWGLTC